MPNRSAPLLACEAARLLGVSAKALRLYEQRGLLQPARSESGYRHYDSDDLRKARDIVALRTLGLGLAEIAAVMQGDALALDLALARREDCPANHSTPFVVPPFAGAAGYEALLSCLATPEVRERVARVPS
jgi:hypothetical protein